MSDNLEFNEKVVLITGSSSGLGAQTAIEFVKLGAQLVITGRNVERISEVANQCNILSPNGRDALQVVADVTVDEDLKRLVDTTVEKFGRIDVLVNNAGAGTFSTIYDSKLIDDLEHMFKLDVRSVAVLTQLVAPHLEKTKGSVINISSAASLKPFMGCTAYCMAKAAVDMFSKCIALELGPKGIRVNIINPTAVRTGFQNNSGAGDMFNGVLDHLEKTNPLRKLPEPQDIANAIIFLASDKSGSITGISVPIDCGTIIS